MTINPQSYHRRSIRLKGYDYTQPGAYFVTLVTQDRACVFGKIENSESRLSRVGQVVQEEWLRLSKRFRNVELDEFVVMPNHIHGIIVLVDVRRGTGVTGEKKIRENHPRAPTEGFGAPVPGSIPTIIRSYKSSVTQCAQWMGKSTGDEGEDQIPAVHPRAPTRIWQRNYYEHIVRNETEWERIRAYIRDNPRRWEDDRDNPLHR